MTRTVKVLFLAGHHSEYDRLENVFHPPRNTYAEHCAVRPPPSLCFPTQCAARWCCCCWCSLKSLVDTLLVSVSSVGACVRACVRACVSPCDVSCSERGGSCVMCRHVCVCVFIYVCEREGERRRFSYFLVLLAGAAASVYLMVPYDRRARRLRTATDWLRFCRRCSTSGMC